MENGLHEVGKTMISRMKNLEIIANNLANINTTGYKREIPFSEYFEREQNRNQSQLTDFTEGSFLNTGNPFDLGISGNGFFMLDTNDAPLLTKNGRFNISENGEIINEQGHKVRTVSGNLNLYGFVFEKKNELVITKDGDIKMGDEIIDTLMIAKVEDQREMKRVDGQNFSFPNGGFTIAARNEFEIHQGYLEESNTNAIMEMQQMINLNKDYEAAQKVIKSLDERMARAKDIGSI
jgi:flagellar basal body rod protein FlgG